MDKQLSHERILIIIALFLLAFIVGYNAFFIPEVYTPTVIYTNSTYEETSEQSLNNDNGTYINNNKININTAESSELCTLPGISTTLSSRIIEYRTSIGNFSSIEEIKNVSGIGEKTFENIRDFICV